MRIERRESGCSATYPLRNSRSSWTASGFPLRAALLRRASRSAAAVSSRGGFVGGAGAFGPSFGRLAGGGTVVDASVTATVGLVGRAGADVAGAGVAARAAEG